MSGAVRALVGMICCHAAGVAGVSVEIKGDVLTVSIERDRVTRVESVKIRGQYADKSVGQLEGIDARVQAVARGNKFDAELPA